MILITRYHDFSCGHRVMHGEGQCARLHGHNYRVTFKVAAPIDETGHAIEFSAIKTKLCAWLEDNWDHRFLLWQDDPMVRIFRYGAAHFRQDLLSDEGVAALQLDASIHLVPFHPTTENIAQYLLDVVGPQQLAGTGATLMAVEVMETRKCGATVYIADEPQPMSVRYDRVGQVERVDVQIGPIEDPRQTEGDI